MDSTAFTRSYSRLGANFTADNPIRFQVWAPKVRSMKVQLISGEMGPGSTVKEFDLERDRTGVFSGEVSNCPPGTLYCFRLDGGSCRPDPRSRFQPQGVHGPSEITDPTSHPWTDGQWTGVKKRDLVIYEMYVGSFSAKGTYQAAIPKLPELVDLGVTAVELMPLAQSPGKWNWGYDGVNFFAPRNTFGRPNDLKHFVNSCHNLGLAIILDVVYNHVGPEGNYLNEFAPYESPRHRTPWGDSLNFDEPQVREFVTDNILYWIDEFHFDGLRLDAVHFLFDEHEPHILAEIQSVFRQYQALTNRNLHLIAETNIFDSELLGKQGSTPSDINIVLEPDFRSHTRPEFLSVQSLRYDAIWSDCMMHSIYKIAAPDIQLTDREYRNDDLAQILDLGYVFSTPQATRANDLVRKQNHPENSRQFIESLVIGLQTHDSVGNHPQGLRIHHLASRHFQKAAAALVLLYPSIPLIFMGEEWATQSPFPFFADFESPELRAAVDNGRRAEYPDKDWAGSVLPSDPQAFLRTQSVPSQLDADMFAWYRQLLLLRRQGIAAGWLNVDCLSSTSDPQSHVYRLIYSSPVIEIKICVSLATSLATSLASREQDQPIPLAALRTKELLLDSRPGSTGLQGEHALIWSSSVARQASTSKP